MSGIPVTRSKAARRRGWRRWLLAALAAGAALLVYLGTTDNQRVWPYRNTLQYHLLRQWQRLVPREDAGTGALSGVVRDEAGQPLPHARVLVAEDDGTPWSVESDASGRYQIDSIPAGRYVPVAGAPGFGDAAIRRLWLFRHTILEGATTELDITLHPARSRTLLPPEAWSLSRPRTLTIEAPLPATAQEQEVKYQVAGRPNQTTLYYTPVGGADLLPTLLTVYPGPAETWAHVSLPLAQAGYAVIAVGPAYALDLEPDVDDLQRLITALRGGAFPRADSERLGLLGGSYSSLHVFRLAERDSEAADAILALGPPTDLFELRRQFEAGTFFPPFGLDQALIALGLPDRAPERYWRYSARYRARSFTVPIMLIHSEVDEVVPFTQSQLLADELERLGKPYELHILKGMGHYLLEPTRTPALDDLFQTTLEFFDRELHAVGS